MNLWPTISFIIAQRWDDTNFPAFVTWKTRLSFSKEHKMAITSDDLTSSRGFLHPTVDTWQRLGCQGSL